MFLEMNIETTLKASSSVLCQINRNPTRFSPDFCHILIDHSSTIDQIIILHNQRLSSASVAKEIQTIQSVGQVSQNQSQCALHMTDFSTHGSNHLAPPLPIALNGVLYAGRLRNWRRLLPCSTRHSGLSETQIKIIGCKMNY